MNIRKTMVIGLAVMSAGGAAFLASSWLDDERSRAQNQALANTPKVALTKIVVAATDLAFGSELTANRLKEIDWPVASVPNGAFTKRSDLLRGDAKRSVLVAMARNEPVLATKVTKPGQRATLSALLEEGQEAVTVRVNDVLGVAGLVQPGDRVDLLWTRKEKKSKDNPQNTDYSELLLQNIQVLAIDQTTVQEGKELAVPKAVTIAVSALQAQKVALAATLGVLSLALRESSTEKVANARRVTVDDLRSSLSNKSSYGADADAGAANSHAVVGVTRALERQEYRVISK